MDTKTHIQEVAIDLFSKKGYHSTSIRDIAIEAKLNSSMVSYYFQSKENLYISLFKTFEVDYLKEFDDHSIFQTEDEALKKFISNSIEFGAKNKKMSILIFSEQIFRTSFTIKNKPALKKIASTIKVTKKSLSPNLIFASIISF